MSDGTAEMKVARWSERFLAWLIDFVIISVVSGAVFMVAVPVPDVQPVEDMDPGSEMEPGRFLAESAGYLWTSVVFFAYWAILEHRTGQSVGKRALNLRVVSADGGASGLSGILISSFGKAFLLPVDVILGWIFTNSNRQRIFNKAGNTVVVKVRRRGVPDGGGVPYEKD